MTHGGWKAPLKHLTAWISDQVAELAIIFFLKMCLNGAWNGVFWVGLIDMLRGDATVHYTSEMPHSSCLGKELIKARTAFKEVC